MSTEPEPTAAADPLVAPPLRDDERFFQVVREALRGSRRDLTRAPLGRAILLLAIPLVTEMIMESIFAVVDIFWGSKLGPDAVASVGLTQSKVGIIHAVTMGLFL